MEEEKIVAYIRLVTLPELLDQLKDTAERFEVNINQISIPVFFQLMKRTPSKDDFNGFDRPDNIN